jgi:hypothetical protein
VYHYHSIKCIAERLFLIGIRARGITVVQDLTRFGHGESNPGCDLMVNEEQREEQGATIRYHNYAWRP